MKKLKKTVFVLTAVLLASLTLLSSVSASPTELDGSKKVDFWWTFNFSPTNQSSFAKKSDANGVNGSHATVRITGYSGNAVFKFAVFKDGYRLTDYQYFNGVGLYELPYVFSVTNVELELRGECISGSGGCSGTWYP